MKSFRNKTNRGASKSNRLTQKNKGGSPSKSPKASAKPKGPTPKEKAFLLLAEFKKPTEIVSKFTKTPITIKTFDIDKARELLADKKWNKKWIDFEDIDLKRNRPGWTALREAVLNTNREGVELLLENGADINKQNKQTGLTALQTAVSRGGPEMVKLLLEKGARTDLEAKYFGTPLEAAEEQEEENPGPFNQRTIALLKEHK